MPVKQQKWAGRPKDQIIEERVSEMIDLLSKDRNIHRCQLHKEFCKKWNVHWKTVDRVVGRARAEIMQRLGRSKESFRADSLAFYEAKTCDTNLTATEQLRAQENIDKLLGLDAPKRTEITGKDGGPLTVEEKNPLKDVPPERLRALAGLDYAGGNGENKGGNGKAEETHVA